MMTGLSVPRDSAEQAIPGTQSRRGGTRCLRSQAFGLDIEAEFAVPGLRPSSPSELRPRTVVELATAETAGSRWRRTDAARVREVRRPDGRLAMTIDHHREDLGYRLRAPG